MQDGEGYHSPSPVLERWRCQQPSPSARVDGWVSPVLERTWGAIADHLAEEKKGQREKLKELCPVKFV